MNESDFVQELRAIVSKVPLDALSRETEKLERLLRIGVDSQNSLQAVALDKNQSVDVRAFACWLLGRVPRNKAIKDQYGNILATLIKLQTDEAVSVRIAATQSLGSFQNEDALEVLIKSLNDENVDIRKVSAQTLGWMKSKRATIALVEKLKDPNEEPIVRGVAAEALGNSGNRIVIGDLIGMLDSQHPDVRFWVIYALGEMCAEAAISKLEQMTSDDTLILYYGTIGQEAKNALENIKRCKSNS